MNLFLYIIIGLAFVLTTGYIIGMKYNYKLQKNIWEILSKDLKKYSKKVKFKSYGSSGFAILCNKLEKLGKTEIDVLLCAREVTLYYMVAKLKGTRDKIHVKANFHIQPLFELEIIRRDSKFIESSLQHLKKWENVEVEAISNQLVVKTTNKKLGTNLLSDKKLIMKLSKVKNSLERISISKDEPHLIITCKLDKEIIIPLIDLARAFGNSMTNIVHGKQ